MNLSIKAVLPEPERKPRAERNEAEGETSSKRTRAPRRNNDEELSDWSEGVSVGTSLGDILANAKKNK
jgi:phage shock protein A